ncbi:MAG: hypothetical protein JWM76_344 [Pseudonocardiales bacterium]|nr:hypothetical protein [Pseudonocardiales bacterium]
MAQWIASDQPGVDVISIVVAWIEQQLEQPYRGGVRRQANIAPNLWFGKIPGTLRDGSDVTCSYWIYEETRTIRCDSIGTLARPN